jgi:hypothetical protein
LTYATNVVLDIVLQNLGSDPIHTPYYGLSTWHSSGVRGKIKLLNQYYALSLAYSADFDLDIPLIDTVAFLGFLVGNCNDGRLRVQRIRNIGTSGIPNNVAVVMSISANDNIDISGDFKKESTWDSLPGGYRNVINWNTGNTRITIRDSDFSGYPSTDNLINILNSASLSGLTMRHCLGLDMGSGPASARPSGASVIPLIYQGMQYFDTDNNEPEWYKGTGWATFNSFVNTYLTALLSNGIVRQTETLAHGAYWSPPAGYYCGMISESATGLILMVYDSSNVWHTSNELLDNFSFKTNGTYIQLYNPNPSAAVTVDYLYYPF